jgi:hypothetical protein
VRRAARAELFRLSVSDLLVIVVLLAAPVYVLASLLRGKAGPVEVRILHGDELVKTLPLNRDTTVLVTGSGVRVKVESRAGRVRVAESNCPNQLCVRAGWVSRPGRTIVCLPNKVLVELRGGQSEYDAESY